MKAIVKVFIAIILFTFTFTGIHVAQEVDPWNRVKQISDSIGTINFPAFSLNVIDFGATGNGTFNNTNAFKKTISACAKKGGGKIIVPAGKFLTGPIHLASNINLCLEEGAEILFSTNPDDYYPLVHTSFEGVELMNYSPLIYAYNCTNVGITGKGTLNGQADNEKWWPWCGKKEYGWKSGMPSQNDSANRPALERMAKEMRTVENRKFGKRHYLRPTFIEPFSCTNVLIEGVKIINAPFWIIHPIKCKNVIVDGVHVESHGPNNDGCDPEYSKNVIIRNSLFNTGDDCIAIKSGRNEDGRRVGIKSENIIVQKCRMIDGHGGIVIGSEVSAGVSNVYAEDCIMSSPELDRIVRIKTNSKRGGTIENIYARNIEVGQVKEAVLHITMFYDVYGSQTGKYLPVVRNINLENIHVKNGGKYGIWAQGYKESPINGITLKNVTIENAENDFFIENAENIRFINSSVNGKPLETK
ncbi:MAG: glycoside hydrolase family 28 protein [Bacteroidales bacterium]